MGMTAVRQKMHRVVTFLDRDHVDLLDRIGKDALFSTGAKFPRTKIIAGLIELLRWANVTGEGIRTEQEFAQRLLEAFRKMDAQELRREAAA